MTEANKAIDTTSTTTTTMDTATDESTAKKIKAPAGPAKLIRGRMPLPLVYAVRFVLLKETMDELGDPIVPTDSSVAKILFTTPGKIMDIRTVSNFAYLVESSTFNQEDIDIAKEQLENNIATGKIRGDSDVTIDFTMVDAKHLFDMLDSMVSDESSIANDRKVYLEANPRANKKKADTNGAETDTNGAETDTNGAETDTTMEAESIPDADTLVDDGVDEDLAELMG